MYTIVKEIHSSTTVEHCIYCHFFSFSEKNLVIASFNQIKVYRLIGEETNDNGPSPPSSSPPPSQPSTTTATLNNLNSKQTNVNSNENGLPTPSSLPLNETTTSAGIEGDKTNNNQSSSKNSNIKVKLECLKTIPLYSEVCCLKSIKLIGSKRDSLLIAFADAKLALVEYDPANHDLKTLSLHYFEDEDIKGGKTQYPRAPVIRVDPEGRCAAMLIYGRTLVIIPFRKDLSSMEESEANLPGLNKENNSNSIPGPGTSQSTTPNKSFSSAKSRTSLTSLDGDLNQAKYPVMASYKLNLNDKQYAEEKIHNIIDFQFLNGYYEPTLLILHEPVRTWAGRVAVRKDTCSMVTLSLNVHQRVHPVIWSTSHLPFDCFAAQPVPKPVGGVIIFAVNSLIYLNQSVPPYAVSLNSFADSTTAFTKTIQKGVKLSLDCSKATFVSNDKLVLSLKGGELYVVTLFSDGMRSIRAFHFDKSASSVISSCMTTCEEGYLFLGSRLGNSLLLKYTEKIVESRPKKEKNILNSSTIEDDPMMNAGSPVPEVLGEEVDPANEPTLSQPITNNTTATTTNESNEPDSQMDSEGENETTLDILLETTSTSKDDDQMVTESNNMDPEDTKNSMPHEPQPLTETATPEDNQQSVNEMINDPKITPPSNIDAPSTSVSLSESKEETISNDNQSPPTNGNGIPGFDEPSNDSNDSVNSPVRHRLSPVNQLHNESTVDSLYNNNLDNNSNTDANTMDDSNLYGVPSESQSNYVNDGDHHMTDLDESENKMNDDFDERVNDKPDNIGDWAAGDVALMKDPDELEVYGQEDDDEEQLTTSFSFELCDSLTNIGPCGRACMGEPAFLPEEFSQSFTDPQVELVTTSGYGKNGALCVLQRTIRPQLVNTFGLPNYIDMWTVFSPSSSVETISENVDDLYNNDFQAKEEKNNFHSFLILTRSDSTMILKTGAEIKELDHSDVSSQTPTIFAGNLADGKYILQVSPMAVRLLEGTRQIQHLPLNLGSPIVFCSLADPYAIILTQHGAMALLTLRIDSETGNCRLAASRLTLTPNKSKVSTLCIYKDVSGKFTTQSSDTVNLNSSHDDPSKSADVERNGFESTESSQIPLIASTIDDEDELLYGSSTIEMITNLPEVNQNGTNSVPVEPSVSSQQNTEQLISPKVIPKQPEYEPTFWLFTIRENGVLEVFRIPDATSVFYVKNFPMGCKILLDMAPGDEVNRADSGVLPVAREILVAGMGISGSRPIMFTRFESEIFIYEMFPYHDLQIPGHLQIRWRRKERTLIVREPRLVRATSTSSTNTRANNNSSQRPTSSDTNASSSSPNILDFEKMHQKWFRPFNDVSGYSGVFICGPFPHWCFMTSRGELRIHEMNIDGPVISFAAFHNVNCQKGFLFINAKSELRIAVLPTHVSYDAPWPVRKIPLRCTIHFVNYHVDSKCYCISTSTQEPYNRVVRVGGEDKDYDILDRDSRYIWPTMERFHIQLFSPVSWEIIPGTKLTLDEWEHVTCLKNVMLSSEGTESGLKGYIAAGTNYCYGEDVTNRGRIWIFDIIDVVPELGQPLTRSKIKVVYCKEQKGPVTAICQIRGLLLSAVGQKVYIWQLKESQLVGVAFIDTQIYIHQAVSMKNLILIADVYKSISLLRYQEDTRTLALASRDWRAFEVYACEFVVDNNQLCFLVADGDKNLLVYSYSPESRESVGGTRLLRRGDYHLGSHVNCFFRIRCKYPSIASSFFTFSSSRSSSHHNSTSNNSSSTISTTTTNAITAAAINNRNNETILDAAEARKITERRHATIFPTFDGTINLMLPVSEKTYRRLFMLQNTMNAHVQHTAGVNPKGVHVVKFYKKCLSNPCKSVLDGDLLCRFLNLSTSEKAELCKKISSTPDQIIDDLSEIDQITGHF